MINDRQGEVAPLAGGRLAAVTRRAGPATESASLTWARRVAALGRGCLIAFAAVAVISANREAGLLTFGALAQISSAVRGQVQIGLVYWLLPVGALLWCAGQVLTKRAANQPLRWSLGPPVIVLPLAVLAALTLSHLSLSLGWADIAFVVAGLGLLILAYLFVLHDPLSPAALAAFFVLVGLVQSLVGVGQFLYQRSLGLGWLGERSLDPAVSGVSVLSNSVRVLRAYGLMRHPNALGAILPLSLLAAINLWLRAGRRERILWLSATLVITAGLALSFSRAGWLAALVGGAVMRMAQVRLGGLSRWSGRWSWAPAVLIVATVGIVAVSLQPSLFVGRLLGTVGAGSSLEQGSLVTRLSSAEFAWSVIRRSPLWGVGTRRFVAVYAQALHVAPSESLLVESTPLVLWSELGVAAPVAWLGLGLALVWLGCRRAGPGACSPDLALATAWVAAVQVVCIFQAYFWPSQQLWQGGLWLGAALALWARAWASSSSPSAGAVPAALEQSSGS